MALNLAYRLERFFCGERGVVEKVQPVPTISTKYGTKDIVDYVKDYFGNFSQEVTFRNPLGEVCSRLSYKMLLSFPFKSEYLRVYKEYKVGDKFP